MYVDSLRESCHGSAALNTEHTEGGGAENSPFFLKGIADDLKPSDITAECKTTLASCTGELERREAFGPQGPGST